MHLTGLYPPWWEGRRWDRPIVAWATGETAESTRDNAQRVLLGQLGEIGTGMIPAKALAGAESGLASGTAGLYDYHKVRYASGGWSLLRFKYYAQGRTKWQGPPVDVLWCDEEPGADIYSEGKARLVATSGCAMMSFTPLKGMSSVVARFLMEQHPDCAEVCMTIDDAEHIPPEERARKVASFAPHERMARAYGEPAIGSGRIFPVEQEQIEVAPFAIPPHWARICGLDFGWDHPTAASWLAYDSDSDTIYVTDCYRQKEAPVSIHAAAIRARGDWIPVAWPADGNNDTAAGANLARQYREHGVAMLPEHAQFPPTIDGEPIRSTVSVEAGIQQMLTRMVTGRWRVFQHLNEWFEEFRLYHRDNGKVVKLRDDLLSSSRYAMMMLRYARTAPIAVGSISPMRRTNWRVV